MKTQFKTRIAPTPSGLLHEGNGASFILTYALARAYAGQILLRIDDLDAERMRLEYLDDIFKTLDWLGVEWDEGPTSVADFQQNWSQHHRLDLYQNALEELKNTVTQSVSGLQLDGAKATMAQNALKGMVYACECSRKQINAASLNGLYPQTCRLKYLDFKTKEMAWRIHVPESTTVMVNNFDLKTKTRL